MNHKGFSLVEVTVCCAVMATLVAVSYPSFTKMRESASFKKEVRELYANLRRAQVEAVKRNQCVVFTVTAKGYRIFVDDGAGGGIKKDWVRQDGEKILVDYRYGDGVEMVKTTFSANRGRFRPVTGVKAGRIRLEGPRDNLRDVVLNTAGRIRVARL